MVKTKVIGSIAAVMLLCMGLYGGLITPAQAQDIAQINQAISIGDMAGRVLGICVFPIYLLIIPLNLYDVILGFMGTMLGGITVNCGAMCSMFEPCIKLIATTGEKVLPESIAEIWNLAVVVVYKTLEGSQWLFEMIPLPFIGMIYKSIINDGILPLCLELLL